MHKGDAIVPTQIYATGWYDGPITGLASWRGRVCFFQGDPYAGQWELWQPSPTHTEKLLADKASFERGVGTHWSFDIPIKARVQRSGATQIAWYAANKNTALKKEQIIVEAEYIGVFILWAGSWKR